MPTMDIRDTENGDPDERSYAQRERDAAEVTPDYILHGTKTGNFQSPVNLVTKVNKPGPPMLSDAEFTWDF